MALDQVEEIKSKVDIVEVIGERVNLKKAGRHYKGLCPFHSEKSPSFIVSPERQSFKCFGCGEGGDVFSFLQKYEAMSFLEVLELLAKKTGVVLESYRPTQADTHKKKLLAVNELAAEYFMYLLTKHKAGEEARAYLKKRGITNEAITNFKLGFAPMQWRGVSEYLTKKKGYSELELEEVGLVARSERGYYDRFRGRIIFPLSDHKGAVVGFAGRTLTADATEAKYINSPETTLYHKSRMLYGLWENREFIRKADTLVIVEGELDMIPSWQAGVKNVAAIKGSAFTEEMAQLVSRYTRNVVYALDADKAGEEAVKRAVKVAEPLDLSIRVVQIGENKDPGDVASTNPQQWREMVKSASLYWDFLLDSLGRRYESGSGVGASKISEEAVPQIAAISNVVVRAKYIRELAKRLSVPEESVYGEIERLNKKKELSSLKSLVKTIEKGEPGASRKDRLEERVLSLALQDYPKLKSEIAQVSLQIFTPGAVEKIMQQVKNFQGEWSIGNFSKTLPEELQPMIDKTYLADLTEVEDVGREWETNVKELTELSLRARLKELSQIIAKAEKENEEKGLLLAKEEFAKLSRELSAVSD